MSNQTRNKIIIIIPYYGRWPSYLNIYLQSLGCNKNLIDVLFVTNLVLPKSIPNPPSNLKFHSLGFEDLKSLIDEKLGFNTSLQDPYKLCDFKPLYGYIFDSLIKEYEYWGFGDIDLIYGNLSKFLDDKLSKYDLLHFRKKWISGSFTLLKNSALTRELFLKSPEIQNILKNPKYVGFDETSLNWTDIRTQQLEDIKFENDNFTSICNRFKSSLRIYSDNLIAEAIPKSRYVRYTDSSIYDSMGKEYMIYHMVTEKRKWYFRTELKDQDSYFITPYGFIDQVVYEKKISYYSRLTQSFILQLPEFLKKILSKFKRKYIG